MFSITFRVIAYIHFFYCSSLKSSKFSLKLEFLLHCHHIWSGPGGQRSAIWNNKYYQLDVNLVSKIYLCDNNIGFYHLTCSSNCSIILLSLGQCPIYKTNQRPIPGILEIFFKTSGPRIFISFCTLPQQQDKQHIHPSYCAGFIAALCPTICHFPQWIHMT